MKKKLKDITVAGIVLYNPNISLLKKNIDSIYKQVDCVVLFDNHSRNIDEIETMLEDYPHLNLIRHNKNMGIAFALNQILYFALSHGYTWCLTLDQDSICAQNMIQEYEKYMDREQVALICPFVINNNKYTMEQYKKIKKRELEIIHYPVDCITSGSLNHVCTVLGIGGYLEPLFIDCVDVELNIRVMRAHYKIIRANATYLTQRMGKAKYIPFFALLYRHTKIELFRKLQFISVYDPKRLYFQSRNSRYIRKKYKRTDFRLSGIYMFFLFFCFTLFYPRNINRIIVWKSVWKGFLDAKYLK